DFYGRRYFEDMERKYGQPPLSQRMRADLTERCVYWLRALLQYKLPPAKVLELGSAHGAFVALLRWAGFDATGLDLSPTVVARARQTFDIPILCGPIEAQQIPSESLDAIVMNDVVEHLRNPLNTVQNAVTRLKSDGVVYLQT